MKILVVIPARGGSKGIPRKNLRYLAGKPLLYYVANVLNNSRYTLDSYLSSEDDEILGLGAKLGLKTHKRDLSIAGDSITLDPVIYDCLLHAEQLENKTYDIVITIQPTSPLLRSESLDNAIEKIINSSDIDTILSATDTTALSWSRENEKFIPLYEKRVNRQYLKPTYTETGGFLITKRNIITLNNRIGRIVELYLLDEAESIDIDTFQDWAICEYLLKKKKILFVLIGNKKVGLGHVYNSLLVANDILNHDIEFLVDSHSAMAAEIISRNNYKVTIQQEHNIINDINRIQPDVVINDRLDTCKEEILKLKEFCKKIINFEDLGDGARYADLVFNAIYPEEDSLDNHYYGAKYFLLRDEFLLSNQKQIEKNVKNVLLTFGGVDPLNNTFHVLEAIYNYCVENDIRLNVIAGFGYNKFETLKKYEKINVLKDIKNISDYMLQADVIFTSAGRTVYEIASLAVPCIVLAQNERELTHYFASSENGFLNLGLGNQISHKMILESFKNLVENYDVRMSSSLHMRKTSFIDGRKTVVNLIKNEIEAL